MRLARFLLCYFQKTDIMKEEKENIIDDKTTKESEATDNANKAKESDDEKTANKQAEEADTADSKPEEKESEAEKDPLETAKEEIAQLKDKYLRSVAEFDNYRKRTLKEKAELILNGSEKAVQAILPIIDDMERAIANAEKTEDVNVLREGMKLIYQKANKIMEGLGVKKIETEDADFDTNYHEAVAMVPGMGDEKKGKVLDCVQTGYTLNDKVIRHAKVAVGQ